jgi:hypothetical protein
MEFCYRADVLRELERHGVRPTPHSSPELVRGFVRELYKYQLRLLRDRYVKKEFPKHEFHARVEALKNQYPVLALLPRQFLD